MRTGVLASFVLLAAAAAVGQTPAPPQASAPSTWPTAQFAASKDPSVQKAYGILNGMIRALGGDVWLNIRNMQTEGRMYGFYHGQPSGTGTEFWLIWEWPDKERVELTKQRDVVELFIGDKGYEITYKGTAEQEPQALQTYLRRRDHSLEWVIRKWLPAPGTMILFDGTALVENNLADQVSVLNAANDSVTISVDGTTHLPVKISYSWRDPVDRQLNDDSTVFSNYKLVEGIQTPFSIVSYRGSDMTGQRFMTSFRYNQALAPKLFETTGITYNPDKQNPRK